MDDKSFNELLESMGQAVAISRGEMPPARVTTYTNDGQRLSPVNVCFDDDGALMRVELSDGQTISVPLVAFPRLLEATPEQRANYELSPCGIHWWPLDENISVAGLLAGKNKEA